MPNAIKGKNGSDVRGTFGFIGAVLKMIRITEATHVAVIFDGEHGNERYGLAPEYKANRPDYSNMELAETPFSQLPYIYSALDKMGIVHKETDHCEADDWLAGYARRIRDMFVIISSNDSDLFQLISSNVRVLRYRGDKSVLCDAEYVHSKFGIFPERYADFKSLTGDSSDNIRGCDKIGPKTAAALISQFSSLEEMIEKADDIARPSVRRSVRECRERILLNKRLIELNYGADLPFRIEEMKYSAEYTATRSVLEGIAF